MSTDRNFLNRIQEIERHVIESVEVAAAVMEELSKMGNTNRDRAVKLCAEFMGNIKAARTLIQQAVSATVPERKFEANSYLTTAKANLTQQKVEVVAMHLDAMLKILQSSQVRGGDGLMEQQSTNNIPYPATLDREVDSQHQGLSTAPPQATTSAGADAGTPATPAGAGPGAAGAQGQGGPVGHGTSHTAGQDVPPHSGSLGADPMSVD